MNIQYESAHKHKRSIAGSIYDSSARPIRPPVDRAKRERERCLRWCEHARRRCHRQPLT